jgi:hypothetical protein
MLTSPVDMMKLWPELWPHEKAAYRTIKRVCGAARLREVAYRLKGPKRSNVSGTSTGR